ncbi:hypothetical protein F2Q69_00011861 [Brassica cretica]|uniref:Uncharacterized protein n=1 Tax=Brassica cretica TaxID=69181 RepID=A0A8S9R0B8_BRACR|nr:hypothetical protein F2Q69_00011861 [Brassica cretica]
MDLKANRFLAVSEIESTGRIMEYTAARSFRGSVVSSCYKVEEYSRLEGSLIFAIIFLVRLSAILALFVNRQAPEVSMFIGVAVTERTLALPCQRRLTSKGTAAATVCRGVQSRSAGLRMGHLVRLVVGDWEQPSEEVKELGDDPTGYTLSPVELKEDGDRDVDSYRRQRREEDGITIITMGVAAHTKITITELEDYRERGFILASESVLLEICTSDELEKIRRASYALTQNRAPPPLVFSDDNDSYEELKEICFLAVSEIQSTWRIMEYTAVRSLRGSVLSILLNHLEYARLESSLISAIIFLDRFSAILALFVNRQSTISFSVYWRCSRRSILFGENSITVSTAAHSGAQLRSLLRLIN